MTVRILQGDCRDMLRTLPECSVDAIVTDPPYDLTSKNGGGPHGKGLDTPFARSRAGAVPGGFMGMRWDSTGVAFQSETWAWASRVLKPGGFLIAFGGTRTHHRLVTAIENAGFELRDTLMWIFGSGFPKSTDKSKIPDEWHGWNTALKPAFEPICLARKPMEGTLAENLRKWGTGALNIDGCRVEASTADVAAAAVPMPRLHVDGDSGHALGARTGRNGSTHDMSAGRWPANIVHDGSDEVLAAFPQAPGAVAPVKGTEPTGHGFSGNVYGAPGTQGRQPSDQRDGGGSAARFFYTAKASRFDRNDGLHGMPERDLNWSSGEQSPGTFQSPKTNRRVQNHHPTVKPTDLMRWLCRLVTPLGGMILDPFMGSGSTLKAAELEGFSAIGIELDPAYIEIARHRIASDAPLFVEIE